jgi:hypothetical protein
VCRLLRFHLEKRPFGLQFRRKRMPKQPRSAIRAMAALVSLEDEKYTLNTPKNNKSKLIDGKTKKM